MEKYKSWRLVFKTFLLNRINFQRNKQKLFTKKPHVGDSVYFEVLTSIKYGVNGIPDLFKNASVASN